MKQFDLKQMAIEFLGLITQGEIQQAYADYAAENMIHHNAYFKGDRESLKNGMLANDQLFPHKIYDVKHVYQDQETVIVHAHLRFEIDDIGMNVIHICRFEQAKIVELWDIGQTIPTEKLNENGVF